MVGITDFLVEEHEELTISPDLLVVHPVSGLIVWVYWIFIPNLLGSCSLLVHVSSTDEFGAKVPAFPSRQLNIHSNVVVGFLNSINH